MLCARPSKHNICCISKLYLVSTLELSCTFSNSPYENPATVVQNVKQEDSGESPLPRRLLNLLCCTTHRLQVAYPLLSRRTLHDLYSISLPIFSSSPPSQAPDLWSCPLYKPSILQPQPSPTPLPSTHLSLSLNARQFPGVKCSLFCSRASHFSINDPNPLAQASFPARSVYSLSTLAPSSLTRTIL